MPKITKRSVDAFVRRRSEREHFLWDSEVRGFGLRLKPSGTATYIAGGIADYIPLSLTTGNLRGICPACDILIYRRVSRARLEDVRGHLEITVLHEELHIADSQYPSVNCDLGKGA